MSMLLVMAAIFVVSCTKEGPAGKDGAPGKDGTDGTDGADGTAGCIACHAPDVVDLVAIQYDFSKHHYGEAAFEESGNVVCSPCHTSEAFKYVVESNIPSTFSLLSTGKYRNDYQTVATDAYGEINCGTCHSSLHTTYTENDLGLTTVAPVSMTMWGGEKTINLPADGGMGNLCVKCHQPRPFVTSSSLSDGNVVDYANLIANPNILYYDSAVGNAAPNKHLPSYRFHIHYGSAGAVYAGMGGIEFGSGYANSFHTANASCQDCHMSTINGRAGGHTFFAKGNFNGCNTTDCHGEGAITATNAPYWTTPRSEIKALLDELANKINEIGSGTAILHSDATASNLWVGLTTGNWDGYLNIYDAGANPTGYWRNPGNTSPPNMAKPKFPSLTNAQVGAMINFQLSLRDYSLGIHNYKYTKALLQNSIAALN
jgi:hypothetical protein